MKKEFTKNRWKNLVFSMTSYVSITTFLTRFSSIKSLWTRRNTNHKFFEIFLAYTLCSIIFASKPLQHLPFNGIHFENIFIISKYISTSETIILTGLLHYNVFYLNCVHHMKMCVLRSYGSLFIRYPHLHMHALLSVLFEH